MANDNCELTREELAALLAISQASSRHRDRAPLFAAIAGAVEGLLPADRFVILVPGSQRATVSVYAVRGARKLFQGTRIPEGSAPAWVIEHRQAVVVSSPEQVRGRFPTTYRKLVEEGMQSAAVMPLLVQDRCVGALVLMAGAPAAFDRVPPRLLEEITGAVALALDGCIADEQLRRLGQERQALLAEPPSAEFERAFERLAVESIARQRAAEAGDRVSFDAYLERYLSRELLQV